MNTPLKPLDGHIPLESSLLSSIAYDPASKTCEVVFARGGRYQYGEFPPEKFEEFKSAESAGKFFLASVKPGHPCTKIPEPEAEGEES